MGVIEEREIDSKRFGFRIYKLLPNGPLSLSGAKELSDFIIPVEEVQNQEISFGEWAKLNADKTIKMTIYSLLTRSFRDIQIRTNPVNHKDGILGASLRKENWTTAHRNLLHITSINGDSFAQKVLKLIPGDDYIIGVQPTEHAVISLNIEGYTPLEILGGVVSKNKGAEVTFYIYNKVSGGRNIKVVLGMKEGFSLGCEGAYGALHEFPRDENLIEELEKEKMEIKEVANDNIVSDKEENINLLAEEKEEISIETDISGKNKVEEVRKIDYIKKKCQFQIQTLKKIN